MKPRTKIQPLPKMAQAISEMKPYKETRGRPRTFEDPGSLTLKMEKADRAHWQRAADQQGTSLNQFVIAAANEKASKKASRPA